MQAVNETSLDNTHSQSSGVFSLNDLPQNQPHVYRGLAHYWQGVQINDDNAFADYLARQARPTPLHCMRTPPAANGRIFYNHDLSGFNFTRERMPLQEALAGILRSVSEQTSRPMDREHSTASIKSVASEGYYVGSTSVEAVMPEFKLHNHLEVFDEMPTGAPIYSFWLSNHSRVAAHYDATENLACVVHGTRKFTLFPPEQVSNLYIGPLDFTPAGQPCSMVDFAQPDYQRFPRFKQAQVNGFEAVLQPGDVIYIPAFWWHHVEATAPLNFMVNYWWRDVAHTLPSPADALLHSIAAIRQMPAHQRQAVRALFEEYVFSDYPQAHIPANKQGILATDEGHYSNALRQLKTLLINKLNR